MAQISKAILKDLQSYGRALRNINYDRNTFLWGPDGGDPILVKDLTTSHLCNIINWVQDRPKQYSTRHGEGAILAFMIGEAEYRRLSAWTNDEPYIIINDNGRAELVPCTQDKENVKNMRIGARK